MSSCPTCGLETITVKLRTSGRFVRCEPRLIGWTNPNRRVPGVRVVTDEGALIFARRRTPELAHHPVVHGWAVHRCDPLFKIP